jgi:DNA-binding CsgD family transcriptional regulator
MAASPLSADETAVLWLAATGLTTAEVADRLGVPLSAARGRFSSAIETLGASSKLEAVVIALRAGWISPPAVERSRPMPDAPEPYDVGQPFDADALLGGFTETSSMHQVDPDSELGRAMASAREAWGAAGPPDPADFVEGSIHPVDIDEED